MHFCVPRNNVSDPLSPDDFGSVREPLDVLVDNVLLAIDADSEHGDFKMTSAITVILV